MKAEMCGATYRRDQAHVIQCTFIKDHPSPNHSWFALKVQDEVDAEATRETWTMSAPIPTEMVPLVTAITSGAMDDCLEILLAAAHGRKRARRSRGPEFTTQREERHEN